MIYYVIELQTGETGACLPVAYADRADAEEKYHHVLQYAAKSEIRKHGAMIITEDGFVVKKEVYVHGEEPAAGIIALQG